MKRYNWQLSDWPNFHYDLTSSYEDLLFIAEKMGEVSGKLAHLAEDEKIEAMVSLIVQEAISTSEIEGEHISRSDIRSSIQNQLGLNPKQVPVHDKRARGIAKLMLDVRRSTQQPLTQAKLFEWHVMLMSGASNPLLKVGYWRTDVEPMQIVSGHYGKWTVHFEAPPAKDVPREMKQFIRWFNQTAPGKTNAIQFAPVRAALAHLYFESIHPFDDGNGRIGRAIAEKALSQGLGYPVLISLSVVIEANKKAYYAALKAASQQNEVTKWVRYFIDLVIKAQIEVERQIDFVLKKSRFFDRYSNALNEREMKVIKRMLQEGVEGFEGGISAKKYMVITGASKATATRDLQHLFSINALQQIGSGRSVRYELNL